MTKPNRKGRWAPESTLNALDRMYALIRGRYETIEQECEAANGLAELIALQDRVDSDKRLMKRTLDAIEEVARYVDPTWNPGHIKPIPPRKKIAPHSTVSRAAMRVLRKAGRPMSLRELSRATLTVLGRPDEEPERRRLDAAIHASFKRLLGTRLAIEPGIPQKYVILAAPSERGSGRGRPNAVAASTPSTPWTPEPEQRRA